jgi:hypothetical protein
VPLAGTLLGTASDSVSFYFSCRKFSLLQNLRNSHTKTSISETKGKTLEELDQVFSVPTHVHAAYGLRQIPYFFGRYVMRRDLKPERLYERETEEDRRASEAGVV